MNRFDTTLTSHIARETGRAFASIDMDGAALGKIVDRWYAEVVKLAGDVPALLTGINDIAQRYTKQLFNLYIEQLEKRGVDSYAAQADIIRKELPDRAKAWILGLARATIEQGSQPGQPSRLPGMRLALPAVDPKEFVNLSSKAKDDLLKRVIFKPMTRQEVRTILLNQQIAGKIAPLTAQIAPHHLIATISRATSQGLNRAQIARQELEPRFHIAKSTAIRVARDSGSMITTQANLQAFQGLGPLLIGYRCNCVTDKNSRPWHQARKGQIYYIHPKEGQKGMEQCPHPPYEPADPSERPPGTPQIAYNCRCYLTPITKSLLEAERLLSTPS